MARRAPRLERLPRGPHGLTREQVVASQRGRVLRAMAEVVAERGYAGTSVGEILRRARVSRETFYEQFSSKDECFMAAFETAVEVVLDGLRAAQSTEGSALERFDRGLRGYLDALADHPAFARLFLVEVHAAGPRALARRAELQRRFAAVLDETFGARTAEERFADDALVAAVSGLVTARAAEGDFDGIRALHGPLMRLVARLH